VADRVQALYQVRRDSRREAALEGRSGAPLDSAIRGGDARHEITGAYWPCLLSWVRGKPTDTALQEIRNAARCQDSRSVLITVDRDTQVLLFPEDSLRGPDRKRLRDAISAVVDVVKARRPGVEIQAVIGDRVGPGVPLALVASRLRRLRRYAFPRWGDPVIWARSDSLACLLEPLDPRRVAAFVQNQLAGLRVYDREHGTNLQRVLELALDHDSRNNAARAAYMHRNTFRRQLHKAVELIDVNLASPEERLALHLALKMRKLGG
jgi:sugar diacid utilization regulator